MNPEDLKKLILLRAESIAVEFTGKTHATKYQLLRAKLMSQFEAFIALEREGCAKIADDATLESGADGMSVIGSAIRARGEA